ncbi:Protein of unknown function [Pseudonocardia thermophila]|jgi:hypothetical protein|uniref:DUF3040 domain-containing protein n=1 Tax=Pseudonocardia thermophila TaxID=1848 RepID=A0A1M6NRB5_PSETH|nr:DUF3040 domain-containing protein [Pseudonocardia thermophila]SHJ98166.1 Protein of unknown function [Pseudonocardia thermophila]
MATIDPRPDDEPRPLDEREQKLLQEIGEGLAARYPRLETRLIPPRSIVVDRVVAALAVLVILAVLLPFAWFAVVLLFAATALPLLLTVPEPGPEQEQEPGDDEGIPPAGYPGF